ncbi:hypothetical protein Tco_1360008 [Tanacetum coccineum]
MEEPEKPTKRKDQIRHDEEVAQRLQAQSTKAELRKKRIVRQREEEANIISWDNVQAMIDADYQMAQQMSSRKEQEKLTQKRNTMSTYLKNMAGYKHNQLKNKSFDDIQKLFDKAMKKVNIFMDMDIELVEGSQVRAEAETAQESIQRERDTEHE